MGADHPKLLGFLSGAILAGALVVLASVLPASSGKTDGPLYHGPDRSDASAAVAPPGSFAPLVERVKDSVVNIQVERAEVRRGPWLLRPKTGGQGSGVIVHEDGWIVTNLHVVFDATEDRQGTTIRVFFSDPSREPETAQLHIRDSFRDLAVLKLRDGPYPYAPIGDSEHVKPGDWAVAIGNPLGYDHSVTAGIVSAKGRHLVMSDGSPFRASRFEVENDFYIQVDSAINPGNSGGPLFNLHGEVIGITTSIIANAEGIGFAIPSNIVRQFLDQVSGRDQGDDVAEPGFLGVSFVMVGPREAAMLRLEEAGGAYVDHVMEDGPAARAGFREGDVIREFAGQKVEVDRERFRRLIYRASAGNTVPVEVLRNGKPIQLSVTLGSPPDTQRRPI
jgi:serine protease Do